MDGEGFTTRPQRIFVCGFCLGLAAMALGINVNWGDIGPWAERVGNGIEAVTEPPTTTQAATP